MYFKGQGMKKRITLVACFSEESNNKIKQVLAVLKSDLLCKVPFNIDDRIVNDTLPYHITLSAWDKEKQDKIVNSINNFKIQKINVKCRFAIMDSTIKGKILYLQPINLGELKRLQNTAFNLLPTERYNPKNYKIHSTLNISEDGEKINCQYNKLKDITLDLDIDRICLFEIYPAKLIASV